MATLEHEFQGTTRHICNPNREYIPDYVIFASEGMWYIRYIDLDAGEDDASVKISEQELIIDYCPYCGIWLDIMTENGKNYNQDLDYEGKEIAK